MNIVPDFAVTLTHKAGTCPIYDSKAMEQFQELTQKRAEAAQKFGVKILSKWSPTRIHKTHWIVEAPSQEAVEEYFKAVGLTIWNEFEIQEVKMIKE